MQRISLVLIPLAAMTAAPARAQTASFDCRKAQTDTEWAVCNTPDLGKLDLEVTTAFHATLAGAKDAARSADGIAQRNWLRNERDRCGGRVNCLATAYRGRLAALKTSPPPPYPPPPDVAGKAARRGDAIVPDCRAGAVAPGDAMPSYAGYTSAVCGNAGLLDQTRRIKAAGDALLPRLPDPWRDAFAAQQTIFPEVAGACPSDESALADCIALAIRQRVQDVDDLAAHFDADLPDCRVTDVEVRDTGFGDAGMSKGTGAYALDYTGTGACRVRGYPAIAVRDPAGARRWSYAVYAEEGSYVRFPGAPLPVTLSPAHPTAWFSLSSSSGCDALNGTSGLEVEIALPRSTDVLKTITLAGATCPKVVVTAVGAISMMRAAIK